jgi:hypothetical protein
MSYINVGFDHPAKPDEMLHFHMRKRMVLMEGDAYRSKSKRAAK